MKIELEDFSMLSEIEKKSRSVKEEAGEDLAKKIQELEEEYKKKLIQKENEYKELLSKVSKESYEQGFADASKKLQKEFEEKFQQIKEEFQRQKEEELQTLRKEFLDFEKEYEERYRLYLMRFTDIVIDSMGEILEFLYIDKSNTPKVIEAMERLIEDFNNYLPLSIRVSEHLYEDIKSRFQNVEVHQDSELKNNEFVIEFHDFKIENRIKEKLGVIKDEIKRETKKLT